MLKFIYIKLAVLGVLFFFPVFSHAGVGEITLIKNKLANAKIVIADKPTRSAQLAVKEFNHYMKKITGAELPVLSDSQPVTGNVVLIGESNYTRKLGLKNSDFKFQEYLIKTFPGTLVLMGHDGQELGKIDYEQTGLWPGWGIDGWYTKPVGTVYAVHDFLRRCGVRWYLPTDIGEVVPHQASIKLTDIDIRRSPSIKNRTYASWAFKIPAKLYLDDGETSKTAKILSVRDKNLFYLRHKDGGKGFFAGHAYAGLQRLSKTHPQYGALGKDGKRHFRQFCYMSPAVQKQVLEDISKRLARLKAYSNAGKDPFGRNWIACTLTPCDGRFWCRCERCQKYFDPKHANDYKRRFSNGYASKYIWTYVSMMAKKINKLAPGKWITNLAYEDYYLPPDKSIKLPENLAVMICRTNMTKYGPLFAPYTFRKKTMLEWKQRVKRIYMWEYFIFPQFPDYNMFPAMVPHKVSEGIKFYKQLGVRGVYFQTVAREKYQPYMAMTHLNFYMAYRLLDNLELDPEKLLDEYYTKFYGPAAAPMRKFFEEMEKIAVKDRSQFHKVMAGGANRPKVNSAYAWTKMCPPGKIQEFAQYFAQAEKLAKKEPYKSRILLMKNAVLKWMQVQSRKIQRSTNVKTFGACAYFNNPGFKLPAFDSKVWDESISLRRFYDKSRGYCSDTQVNMLYDKRYIYIRAMCAQPEKTAALNHKRDSYNSCDNFVEIFLDACNGDIYKQFIINPIGTVYDGAGKDRKWNSNIKTMQGTMPKGWYIVVRIPFSDISNKLVAAPPPRTVWRANFCRSRRDKTGSAQAGTSWAPVNDFHQPKEFGKIIFIK